VIVIDSSVLVKLLSREEGWKEARRLVAEGSMTVDLAIKEVANALWKKILRDEVDLQTVLEIVSDLSSGNVVKLVSQEDLMRDALELAVKTRITVYDALFIALAKKTGLRLATADREQARAAEQAGVEVVLL
jgi:predicted nucleic acid-binding protein